MLCHVRYFTVVHRVSSYDVWASVVMALRFSCSAACGILVPQPGIELLSPALQGEFLTTGSLKEQESSRKTSTSAKAFDCVDHNKWWKILQEMGIPDHLTCVLRNLYASQEAPVRTRHGTTDWFQIGKGLHQGFILLPCLFNLYAEYIM